MAGYRGLTRLLLHGALVELLAGAYLAGELVLEGLLVQMRGCAGGFVLT